MPFPTHREKFPTAEAPKRGTHVPRRLLCSRYGAMQLQRVPSCHQSVGFTFCPCSGLLPLPPGSRRRALACPASLPRPVRLPASRLRPAPAPPVSVMRRPGLAVLRKRRRQRSAPSCPFPSITARMPPFPSATLGLVFRLPTARPPRRAVLFLFRPQRRKHFCRFRSKVLLFSFIINMLLIASAKNSPFFRKTPLSLRQQKRKTFLL